MPLLLWRSQHMPLAKKHLQPKHLKKKSANYMPLTK
jgi:hypothetical protein